MLQVSALSFHFEHLPPLFAPLSFELRRGEVLYLEGANGSGKSTLLSLLAGVRPLQSGSIQFIEPSGKHCQNRKRAIEYLSTDHNGLFLKMDALQNLRFWLQLRQKDLSSAELVTLLTKWQLNHFAIRKGLAVENFSTGMKRRLALARAFASATPCLLLDEPLNGLDQQGCDLFAHHLGEHKKRGGMAIIVSHHRDSFLQHVTRNLTLNRQSQEAT